MTARSAAAWIACVALCGPAQAVTGDWTFRALLDGKPIGQHRFSVSEYGDERKVTSQADFAVRFLGFTAYQYTHTAVEQWRGDCITALVAKTNDGGKSVEVHAEQNGDGLDVTAGRAPEPLKGCVMTFAYWNPAIRTQTRLLNPQTGRVERVQVSRVGDGSIDVHGVPTPAIQFRITGPSAPILVWYSPQGEWLGLDSIVGGNHKLSYRLP